MASNRVMAADTEQPGARWGMLLRGTCLWEEGGEKEVGKSQEEGIWGEKSESVIPQQMGCEGFTYWKLYKFILLILTRPSPFGFLSHSLKSYFRPSPPSSDFLLFRHFPPHCQPPLCQESLKSSNQNSFSFLPSWRQTDLHLILLSLPSLLPPHAPEPCPPPLEPGMINFPHCHTKTDQFSSYLTTLGVFKQIYWDMIYIPYNIFI